MKNHVPSLKTCHKLKAAGFPLKTMFFWIRDFNAWDDERWVVESIHAPSTGYPAPLLTEVLEQLPNDVEIKRAIEGDYNIVSYQLGGGYMDKDNPAEAAALLWLELHTQVAP